MRKKLSFITQAVATLSFAFSMLFSALPAGAQTWVSLSAGDLIKLPDDGNVSTTVDTAIYYFGADGLRYVFPNSKTYFTWYSGFTGVKSVSATQLGTIGIGGNVTYRPGSRMIKIDSDPKVYAVGHGGARRWVTTQEVAIALYGTDWNKKIDDVPDAFFSNYKDGEAINTSSQYNVSSVLASNANITVDKELVPPLEVSVNPDGTFTPSTFNITVGRTARFTNNTGVVARIASDPHPDHTDLPGFDSAYIPVELNYVFKFKTTGSFGFHNDSNPTSLQGTVTVVAQ
ncbi:MAG: hypothetical protein Q8P82_00115 [bacterium]|nr:hypothetical protein [bacterium]